MPDQKFKGLSDLIGLVMSVAKLIVDAPKPLNLGSLSLIFPLLPQLEALSGEIGDIPSELKEVDSAEAEALLEQVIAGLPLDSDPKAKAIASAALKVVVDGFDLVKSIQA